ncbi:S24/S26 family peptidase [Myxococcus sp. K15C18031901]|uniref:S24/S26 family peptidase n=1 Tax=Myxococcus dinghuensis TaxID=2906761 RepID=UPI0020A6F959|nr:S24/S26 family peptidase [Myxococcus dinghuensis]MCP3099375.1 S24/S26 family peptidase [Myxococcus dinghuensis]
MSRESSTSAMPSGLRWIPVQGDSMWPSLRAGDLAGVEPLEAAPRPGEVVLARFAEALVLHRVRATGQGMLSLRGDNAARVDPPLPLSHVLGRVRRVRRAGVELEGWDWGPSRLGRVRALVKRRVARWLGKGARP